MNDFNTLKAMDSKGKTNKTQLSLWHYRSVGFKLFVAVMSGATVGLASMSFLFYQTFYQQIENRLMQSLDQEVQKFDGSMRTMAQSGLDMAAAVSSLHDSGIRNSEAYKNLQFKFFQKRLPMLKAIAFGQLPYKLVNDRQWFWPYFFVDPKVEGIAETKLPAPNNNIIYSDAAIDDNYPIQDYYQIPLKNKKNLWLEPYINYGSTIATFACPIYSEKEELLGIVNVDVNVSTLTEQLKGTVIENRGYFTVISDRGILITYPPEVVKDKKNLVTYQNVPELVKIWPQIQQGNLGLIKHENQIFAYQRIPSTNWLMLASVPESIILKPVWIVTIAGTIVASLCLFLGVLIFARRLNNKLEPIFQECHLLTFPDEDFEKDLQRQNEIERLSISFFNLIEQLNNNEEKLRLQSEERLKAALSIQEQAKALNADITQILHVVEALESGDLTVQARVSEVETSLIADNLNILIEKLGQIITAVLSTTNQVVEASQYLETQAILTTRQAKEQNLALEKAETLVKKVSHLSHHNCQQVIASTEALQKVETVLEKGQLEMTVMSGGIKVLQENTEQMLKRAQMLDEFVTLAVHFNKEQKKVAVLTRILALNASTIAKRASAQKDPQQFAAMAREFETIAAQVNDLAMQTSNSLIFLQQKTDRIETVVEGINQDIQEIEDSVGQFTKSVFNSEQAFDKIHQATKKVTRIGRQVTKSSQTIADVSQTTLQTIEAIATLAKDTEMQSDFTRQQTNSIQEITSILLEKVRFFRISDKGRGVGE